MFGMTAPLFVEKLYRVKGFFLTKLDFCLFYISCINEIKGDHFKRCKEDNLHLHPKRSFINQWNKNSPPTALFRVDFFICITM